MTIISSSPPRSVCFRYIADIPLWTKEKPFVVDQIEKAQGESISNIEYEDHETENLHDLRGSESQLDIYEHSFQFFNRPTELIKLPEEEMMVPYAEHVNDVLGDIFKTDHVFTYDLRFRENRTFSGDESLSTSRRVPSPTVSIVHGDHTREGGWNRIARTLSEEELAEYQSGRWRARIVNVWRSILPVVEDSPLAFLDPSTVNEKDLLEVDRVSAVSYGTIYNIKYNPSHKWYWLSKQTSEEIAVFVCFDSDPPERKFNFCPHSAFTDPQTRADVPFRQSVETRSIVFTRL